MKRLRLGAAALFAIALAGCGVRGVQMQENPLLRRFERKHGLLAYEGPDSNIYTIDQTGANRKQITTDAASDDTGSKAYGAPTWSFDGRYLAYAMYHNAPSGEHVEGALILGNRDGSNPRVLYQDTLRIPFYIYFTPDTKYLSLLSQRTDVPTYEFGVFPVQGSGEYRKLDDGAPYNMVWLQDGSSILSYVGGQRLSLISVDPEPVRTDLPVTPGVFQAPDVASDGKRLLYVTGSPPDSKLVLREIRGGAETVVASSTGILFFAFSPDAKRIAYLEWSTEADWSGGPITIVEPGSTAKPVRLKDENILGFYWSPDSRKLAYFIPSPPQKQGDLDEAFALDEAMAYIAVMIADAKKGRSWLGSRFPTTEGYLNNIPYFDQLQRSDTMWSPDSKYFVFSAYTVDMVAALFIASADGNLKARFIDYGGNASWSRK